MSQNQSEILIHYTLDTLDCSLLGTFPLFAKLTTGLLFLQFLNRVFDPVEKPGCALLLLLFSVSLKSILECSEASNFVICSTHVGRKEHIDVASQRPRSLIDTVFDEVKELIGEGFQSLTLSELTETHTELLNME